MNEASRQKIFFILIASLVVILPIANLPAVRSALFIAPAIVWIYGMVVERRWNIRRTPMDLPLLLFFAAIVVSIFTSMKPELSIDELRKEFLTYTLVFYMVAHMITDDEKIVNMVKALVLASIAMALYGITEFYYMGGSIFGLNYRAGSLHQGFEAYAQYIIMVLPFAAAGLVYAARQGLKGALIWAVAAVALNLFALYLTHTRGAWIALWVEMFLLSFLLIKGVRVRLIIAILLVILPIAAFKLLPESVVWHGSKGLDIPEQNVITNTGSARLKVWQGAFKGVVDEPFKGAGYGRTNFRRRFPGPEFLGFDQAHNSFVNVTVQLGVQGLFALLFIIGALFHACWTVYRRGEDRFRTHFASAVIIMTAGFFTANMFAEFYIDDTALMFWIFAALVVSVYKRPVGES
ncbi:MAG: O-antigen ligase family protein [Nitrospirota bacterium]|nr:O-antigen ligase family protein [Nitrospirota bacterium]